MPQNEFNYSEEAQEILGRIPSWIIRWGITVIFIIFLGIIIGSFLIEYPQTVEAPVQITTMNPPADLMARSSGRIDTILVKDQSDIEKNQLIAVLSTPADYQSVFIIEDKLKQTAHMSGSQIAQLDWLDKDYLLGEIQSYYMEFRRICLDYRHYNSQNFLGKKQELLNQQIRKNKEYYNKQLAQKKTIDEDIFYEKKSIARDSVLYNNNVISSSDYEQGIRALLQKESTSKSFEASLTSTELNILQMEQQLIEISIQQQDEVADYERRISNARQQLLSQIEQWKYQYVITSPVKGRITLTKFWSSNQIIQLGERFASIIPHDSLQVIGRMYIPSSGLGKVETGQTVNIKLNSYPHMEFGQLRGKVTSISEVPDEFGYAAEIIFPDGLTTTYKKDLNLIQHMDGVGEIVTRDQKLIESFLQPVKAMLENNS